MSRQIILVLACLLSFGCDDIIEKDISKNDITIRMPPDEYSTSETEQLFWWEPLEGATSYQLIITSPDFQNPITLALDSVTTENKVMVVLPVADYEWCVKAKNSGYSTEYFCRKLYITN